MSISLDTRLRFERICAEELSSCSRVQNSIGTYKEKRIHIVLKRFVCDDSSHYEIKIKDTLNGKKCLNSSNKAGECSRTDEKNRLRSFVADVLDDNCVYEIQTGSLYPLVKKIDFVLKQTDYSMTIVHPIAHIKWVIWLEPESGSITSRRKSPKKETALSIARDLYCLAPYIGNSKLKIMLPMLEVEEYRLQNGWGRNGKRGSVRFERYPLQLLDCVELISKEDYVNTFIPPSLPKEFTAAQYMRAAGIAGINAYSVLNAFCTPGILKKGDKSGKSHTYIRTHE